MTIRFPLRLAIALVGLRITARLLTDVGALPIAIAVCELVLMFAFTWFVARRLFRLEGEFSLLLAAGIPWVRHSLLPCPPAPHAAGAQSNVGG